MKKVEQLHGESRKDYLVRVAIIMLNENAYIIETIEYDEAECDALCLAQELQDEFCIDLEED